MMRCEERIPTTGLMDRPCKGKGLVVCVHPTGDPERTVEKVWCSVHARRSYVFGWVPDWTESERRFGTKPPKEGARRGGIGDHGGS